MPPGRHWPEEGQEGGQTLEEGGMKIIALLAIIAAYVVVGLVDDMPCQRITQEEPHYALYK